LNETVSEDRFLHFDGFSHFFDIDALFDSLFLFLGSLSLFSILFACSLLGVGSSLDLSYIRHYLLLDRHCQETIKSWECVVFKFGGVSLGGQIFNGRGFFSLWEGNFNS
jgi:hypothetical protein